MSRFSFYVDGFNVYHVIDEFCPACKWLDLHKLLKSVIPRSETIAALYYFSALSYWKPDRVERHRSYIAALKSSGVVAVLGRFKEKERECLKCHHQYVGHEEKMTDVSIALKMLEDAMDDRFDSACLVSGDSDFVPLLATIKRRFPEKRVGVMIPIGARAKELREVSDFIIKMKRRHLQDNQFPEEIRTREEVIRKPQRWK